MLSFQTPEVTPTQPTTWLSVSRKAGDVYCSSQHATPFVSKWMLYLHRILHILP